MSRKRVKKKSSKRKVLILAIEISILAVLLGVLWTVLKFTDPETGAQKTELNLDHVVVNVEAQENETLETYRTIALFGVDSREGELGTGTLSDTIMIASVNNETKEVKLISVYRDTYLNLGNDSYGKCNKAYSIGGPTGAISMLNANLDLNITEFVTVGFEGLLEVVDAIGGIQMEIKESEITHINNYQLSLRMEWGLDDNYTPIEEAGVQTLNGLQAVSYCRVRQVGDDYQRTARQRAVIAAILEESKTMDLAELTSLVNHSFGMISTNIDVTDMIEILTGLATYELVDEGGFPAREDLTTTSIPGSGDSIIAMDLSSSVEEFHANFFDADDYEASEKVIEINEKIQSVY